MKKLSLRFHLMTSNAFAEAIPQPILEVINVYQHGSFGLDKGVLSMAVKKPSVNEDMAVLFFRASAIRNTLARHGIPTVKRL